MARQRKMREQINDADFILKKVTGKGILDYGKMIYDLFGKGAVESFTKRPEEEERDREDLIDCRLLGADNLYSYRVFKFAVRVFREENHPDRFPAALKPVQEERFKMGEGAIARICQRRGWRVP